MKKCLLLAFTWQELSKSLEAKILKQARALEVEGYMRLKRDGSVRLEVCGDKEPVDGFIEFVEGLLDDDALDSMTVDPHINSRDFRGVFRVIA